jgi:hypothetical protein
MVEKKIFHSVSMVFLTKYLRGLMRGSFQAKSVQVFDQIPSLIIPVQQKFLIDHQLLKD